MLLKVLLAQFASYKYNIRHLELSFAPCWYAVFRGLLTFGNLCIGIEMALLSLEDVHLIASLQPFYLAV